MATRNSILAMTASAIVLMLSGCGGGGGSTGGNGGGGGGSGLSISLLAPSSVMTGIPLGQLMVFGHGFTQQSQILANGTPLPQTFFIDSGTLQAEANISLFATAGTLQFTVENGGQMSNSLPFAVYTPQPGPQVMQALPGYLVGNEVNPLYIAVGDLNGDGFADVVMPPNDAQSIAILYGHADGSLSPPVILPTQARFALQTVVIGDVNGDGNPDLVYVSSDNSSTAIGVLIGDGHGNFQQPSSQQPIAGQYPGQAVLADIDGDGNLDLVVATENQTGTGGNVFWLKGDGHGNFGVPIALAATGSSLSLSVADFNRDGKPDILYTGVDASGGSALHIMLNQGGGHFTDTLPPGLNGVSGLANVIDFNLDGIPDLVVQVFQGPAQLYSFAGNGDGSFTQVASANLGIGIGQVSLVAGDFDHDGFPDLAGPAGLEPSELVFLFGDGHGNFVQQNVVGPEGSLVAAGDINGDGIPDVIVPDRFNFVSVALGRTDRNFSSPVSLTPATVTELAVGDIDGDGWPDILAAGDPINGIPATVFQNQRNNTFTLAAYVDPGAFTLADLTGKGVVDLIGGKGSNVVIWPNNGSFDFSSSPITVPQPSSDIALVDMDGDGHLDFVSACQYGICPGQVFYGNGLYQFNPVTVPNLDWPYVIGDFNGDGKLDIATGYAVFLNTGNRTFQKVASNTTPIGNAVQAVVADFNGDGKNDIALVLPGDTSISIWYGRGDGTFYEGTLLDPGQYTGGLAVGDFNGDGRPDLVAGLEFSHQVCIFFNNGNRQFMRSFFASGADTIGMIATDLNRDGKPDLVIGNFVFSFEPANIDVVFHK